MWHDILVCHNMLVDRSTWETTGNVGNVGQRISTRSYLRCLMDLQELPVGENIHSSMDDLHAQLRGQHTEALDSICKRDDELKKVSAEYERVSGKACTAHKLTGTLYGMGSFLRIFLGIPV